MSSKKRNREEEDVVVLEDDEKVKTSSVKGKPPPSKKKQSAEIAPEKETLASLPKEDEKTAASTVVETPKAAKDVVPLFPVPGMRMLRIRNNDSMNDETSGVLVTNPTEVSWKWNAEERIITIAKPFRFHFFNDGDETFRFVMGSMTITMPPGACCVGVDVKRTFIYTTKGANMRMVFGGGRGGFMAVNNQNTTATFYF